MAITLKQARKDICDRMSAEANRKQTEGIYKSLRDESARYFTLEELIVICRTPSRTDTSQFERDMLRYMNALRKRVLKRKSKSSS